MKKSTSDVPLLSVVDIWLDDKELEDVAWALEDVGKKDELVLDVLAQMKQGRSQKAYGGKESGPNPIWVAFPP
jgi:hypothetical protein